MNNTPIDNHNIKNIIQKMDNINFSDNIPKKQLKLICNKDLDPISKKRLTLLREHVKKLLKIPQPEQRSQQWYKMRGDKITASDWAAALGKNPYSYRKGLLRTKCGEQKSFYGGHMQHGVKYEPVANLIYEYRNKTQIIEFGLLPHPKIHFLGASPDGITENGIMVEIKCPPKREITGDPLLYYWIQVQGQLEVCELDRCDFMECKFEEYVFDEDYFEDNYNGNYFYNGLGHEKGIILVFMDKTTTDLTHKYAKLGINRDEYLKWFEQEKEKVLENKKMIYVETTYWKLMEVSCVPIYRDQKWFEDNLPELQKFWDQVLHYRKVGTDEIKPKPRKKKEDPRIFIETEIEDFNNNSKLFNAINDYHNPNKFKNKYMFSNTNLHSDTQSNEIQSNEIKSDEIKSDEIKVKEDKFVRIKIKKKLDYKVYLFSK